MRAGWMAFVLATLCCVAAASARPPYVVVPAGHKLAGDGYAGWLARMHQYAFSHPDTGPACPTVVAAGERVALLYRAGRRQHCAVAAGRSLYVAGLSAECSPLDDGDFHARTRAGLLHCARRADRLPHRDSMQIDGQPVRAYKKLAAATRVFTVHLHRSKAVPGKPRVARSAAYGRGVLLTRLTPGRHTIVARAAVPAYGYRSVRRYVITVGR